jgi:aryl-phospho-beta-D-glucosidase BglC (GH1 family)
MRIRLFATSLVATLLTTHLLANAQTVSPQANVGRAIAASRAAVLTRGTNLSGWFGGWGDYSIEHTSTYITAADIAAMKSMGIQYVRFPVDPILFNRAAGNPAELEQLWKRIDTALDMVMNAGLAVDLVVFPRDDYKQQLSTQSGVDHFVILWQTLAKHLAARDPDRFFFELMNESQTSDPYRWIGIQSQVIYAIREIDPKHTILASGAHYDSIPDLLETQPIADSNVIYTFHFYEPYTFTHQGAPWGSVEWNYYKDIPYPATPESIAPILPSVPGGNARYQLYLYGQGNWNKKGISQRLAFAAAWGKEHGVPVICNEFGAFRDTAPPDSRRRYLRDVMQALEEQGIGWAMWDWNGNFGLVRHSDGKIVPDADLVRDLGLVAQ